MKTLTLMRHAKSDWSTGLADIDRPLNQRGTRAAPDMANRLVQEIRMQRMPKIDLILVSPAVRAEHTGLAVATALHMELQTDQRLYPFTIADVIATLSEQCESLQHIMLVGHNPGIAMLAHQLSGNHYDMPTAAQCSLVIDIKRWQDITKGVGIVQRYDYPKSSR